MKKFLISVSAILTVASFCLNAAVLRVLYPDADADYDVWLEYRDAQIKVYEAMFALFFLNMFLLNKGLLRAMCCFAFIMASASFLDKTFFQKNMYLYSDIVIGTLAAYVSFLVYRKEKWKPPSSL